MTLDLATSDVVEPDVTGWAAPGEEPARAVHAIFDRALALALLAKALPESDGTPASLAWRLGLDGADLAAFIRFCGWPEPPCDRARADVAIPDEQRWVRDLLLRHAAPASSLAPLLASVIARRAMEANHLWEDLGLPSRAMLHHTMHRHFPALAAANTGKMRWKRYFYRTLCEEEGLSHCTSPTCSACADVDLCFETGSAEHRIAQSKPAPPAKAGR